MKMAYVSDSVFYTDGTNYYCQVYFSPDEIVSLCPGVDHLFVISRIRKKGETGVYKKISWSACTVEFVNVEGPGCSKLKQFRKTYQIDKRIDRESDVSYLKFCFISSYIYGLRLKKKHEGKVYFSQMVGDPDCILSFSSSKVEQVLLSLLNRFQKRCYASIAKKMDLQVFVSGKLKEKYAVPSVKAIVANENRFREEDVVTMEEVQQRESTDTLRLLFVGRLSPEKRVQDLLAVLKGRENVQLSIVGDGAKKSELLDFVNANALSDTVFFLGRKEWGEELFSEMKKHDVLVLTSENEGLALVLVEAMGCGLPVIASRVGGVPEVVQNGINGILFEKGNLDMLKDAIERMRDATFRRELVSGGLRTAHALSFDKQIQILKNELEPLLRKK